MVFCNALQRIPDEANMALLKIGKSPEIIEQFAGPGVSRQGIDREIAPRCIFLPVIGKSDRRAAAIGRDVAAESRDFERMSITDGSDSAMVDSRRHGFDARFFEALHHRLGRNPGREIDVADRQAEEVVSNCTTDVASQPFVCAERIEETLHPPLLAPFWSVERQHHCSLRERLTIIAAVAPQILRSFHTIS